MSVDDRIRTALRQQADVLDPSPESALLAVRSRGRRARWLAASATAAAAVGVLVAGAVVWDRLPAPAGTEPAREPTSAAEPDIPEAPLRGLIRADVTRPVALAGTWALRLNGNGTMDVEPPTDYPGVVSGALFTADGSTLRTTLLADGACTGAGTGIYGWLAVGERIEFTVVSDPCRARVRFFEEAVWTSSTVGAPRG